MGLRPGTKSEENTWEGGQSPKQLGLRHVFTDDVDQGRLSSEQKTATLGHLSCFLLCGQDKVGVWSDCRVTEAACAACL